MTPTVVPILLYHSINDSPPSWIAPFTVRPAAFARHLDLIAGLGCQPITVSQMADGLASAPPWPERPVVITLDDGFADTASIVAPALVGRGFPATLYVTTGALSGGPAPVCHRLPPAAMLTWAQLPYLEQGGIEIGAHTLTHPALDTLPLPMSRREIRDSKARLEEALGHGVRSFAYPHGHHDRRVATLVRQAGFDSACAVKNRLSGVADDRFALARLTVMASTTPETLARWLVGCGAPLGSPRRRLRTRAGRQYRRLLARPWR